MKYIGEGDLEARVDIKSRDELGVVAQEFNKMVAKTSELMNNIFREQKKKREYELAMLQSQINPHFLYNTLESICGLAELNRNEDIISTVNELAAFYRGVLSKGSNIIPIEDEISITVNYLNIIKVRYGDKFDYTIELDDEIFKYNTVKLVLQPLIENSIYHGLKNKRGRGMISIKGFVKNGKVNLHVSDNGIGMTSGELKRLFNNEDMGYSKRGFGLKSTNERIKLYFGNEYGLQIESALGKGTTVKVTLPARVFGG